jgi:hypothetical protein
MTNYSGTFLKWAEPLLELVVDAPHQARISALEIATSTWNAVTLEDAGVAPGSIDELQQRIAAMPNPGKTIFGGIVVKLVESRRTEFSTEAWTISKCELRGKGSNTRVMVEARAVPTRSSTRHDG